MAWAHGGEGGGAHFFADALPWVIAVFVIVLLVRWGRGIAGRRKDRALRALHERYAKGEINKDQLERMKADLGR